MELNSLKEVKCSIEDAYINEDIMTILIRGYVKSIQRKARQPFIICWIYERAQSN